MKKIFKKVIVLVVLISIFLFANLGTKARTLSYKNVIDSFNVITNLNYQPQSTETYCNIFAQDVMKKLATPLPSGTCATILDKLSKGISHWHVVTASYAQARANAGFSAIAITNDHIVVIYPHGNTAKTAGDLWMSMAGYKCFNNTSIKYAWKSSDLSKLKFYSWFN
ncbi:hypothetical protein NNC19_01525 [Clostridium sp. SHJSY1]|uniref:hypothetical protein n=1 Tax=Clostridium sp. SHJSY1 TaxID=2942483 RepID=UPI002875EEB9|nr:hypothetical protein [Clostridium sp. SHJSY1]MDS0524339.1 hypothetical protein [Clostridium sp. SHJSY1]